MCQCLRWMGRGCLCSTYPQVAVFFVALPQLFDGEVRGRWSEETDFGKRAAVVGLQGDDAVYAFRAGLVDREGSSVSGGSSHFCQSLVKSNKDKQLVLAQSVTC